MENLNAEQIKKVLEHCANWTVEKGCKGCPYEETCIYEDVVKDALTLITSQEQRIKELTEENEAWQKALITEKENASKAYYNLACEVEDLRAIAEQYQKQFEDCAEDRAKLTEENERLRAEDVIRLPLKVGDIVYTYTHFWRKKDGISPYQITNITLTQNKKEIWTKKYRAMQMVDGKTIDYQLNFAFEEIGKTVFLTKEEADQIAKEMVNDCTQCKHFVGCECFDGKTCTKFEKTKP